METHSGVGLSSRVSAVKLLICQLEFRIRVNFFGTNSAEACDYPLFGYKAAKAVSDKNADFGIVICKTGFGMAIVANKLKGVRSAVCDNAAEAESARKHNGCNVISLGATRIDAETAKQVVDVFLSTEAEGGRHQRRVDQIIELENPK